MIVTASRALARALAQEHTRRHQRAGDAVWESADVVPWSGWMRRLWDEVTANPPEELPAVLDPRQELLVWEAIIGESPQGAGLFNTSAAARLAREAHATVVAWRLPVAGAAYRATEDAEAFEHWQAEFLRRCKRNGWAPAIRQADLLAQHLPLGGDVELAGFEQLTPQQQQFVARFAARRAEAVVVDARAGARLFPDARMERSAAAAWARAKLDEEPDARLAIYAFDLGVARTAWQEALERELAGRYAMAVGEPLASLPLVAAALQLMELVHSQVDVATAGAILLSPYVKGFAQERFARAEADAWLRRRGGPTAVADHMVRFDDCPLLAGLLQQWRRKREELPPKQYPSAWARTFHELLAHFGWPGEARLNQDEFPVFEAWSDALAQFAALDRVAQPMTAAEARRRLREVVDDTAYEAPRRQVAVDVRTAPDALGAAYDGAWLAGAHDGVWPAAAEWNPLIPRALQREHGIPGATAEDVLARAARWTRGLLESAPEVVASTATAERKEPRRLSSLLRHLPVTLATSDTPVVRSAATEDFSDEYAASVAAGPQAGGTRLLDWQAKCPFHAFAEYRLHVRELEEPSLGYNPRDLGTALHRALEYCWRQWGTSARMQAMPREQLRAEVMAHVSQALTDCWTSSQPLRTELRKIEVERLTEVLVRWLKVEGNRPPFEVLHQERELTVTVGGLELQTRADRVDLLADGRVVLVDYKANAKALTPWEGERLHELQLPLYAVHAGRPVAGVVFAQVQAEEPRFKGWTTGKGLIPGAQAKLKERVLERWEESLEAHAAGYRAGDARVDPVKGACEMCRMEPLCRTKDQGAAGEDEDGD